MFIKEIGVVKFSEVCKRIFDFQIHDYRFSDGRNRDIQKDIDTFLTEKLYPQFMEFNIGEWSLEKFMATAAKDNVPYKNTFWLKTKMKVVN